jgi:hypothetical protein
MRAPHYTVVEDVVLDDSRLTWKGLGVYVALRRHVNADGTCWPSKRRLAAIARCTVRSVDAGLEELRTCGYLVGASGKISGKSNTYTLVLPEVDRSAPHAEGSAPHAEGGRHHVPTEVSSERSTLREEHAVAVAPARTRPRDTSWQSIADLFVARGGHWTSGGKEAVSLDRLIAWARLEYVSEWQARLRDVMDGAWLLIQGKVLGLKTSDAEWWKRQPYTPSSLLCHAKRVVATLHAVTANNTVSPEFLEQLEKDWGPKIRKRQALEAKV